MVEPKMRAKRCEKISKIFDDVPVSRDAIDCETP